MSQSKIRVLHIDTERSWRGGQQQVAYLLVEMKRLGIATELICQPNSEIQRYCASRQLPYKAIRMRNEFDFIAGARIALYCRKNNYRILQLHSSHALAIGIWAKLFNRKLKLIAVRRVDFHIKKNWFSQFKYKSTYLDKIVCISDAIKRVLIEDGVSQEKLVTIYSGIDIHRFTNEISTNHVRENYNIPQDHILIGTVAAIEDHKDYPNLLKAARIVIDNHNKCTFMAVGDGSLKDDMLQLAKQLSLDGQFIFAGFQSSVGQYLKSFDIFVLASHLEGLGTSILDAQAIGLPVVASNVGGIAEIVQHGVNGLLVPPKNENALAKAILHIIQDEDLKRRLSENSLRSINRFDIKHTVNSNLKLYESLL